MCRTGDMVYEVQEAQHVQLILLRPDAPVQPLAQVEQQVVDVPLPTRACPLSLP